MTNLRKAFIAIPLIALLGACGPAVGSGPVRAELTEFAIELAPAAVAAGDVQFDINNAGTIEHEFVIVDTDTLAADLTVEGEGVSEEGMTVVDEVEDIAAGATPTLTVSLSAGHYALICNLPGHYAGGMHADLTVE